MSSVIFLPLIHSGLTLLAEQKSLGLTKAMQPWRCWWYHAGYKWHFCALVLSPKLVILQRYFLISWYLGVICKKYERELRPLTQIHKHWSRIHWPNLPWNQSCITDSYQHSSMFIILFLLNRMAWQWAETLVEIRGTLADIRGTTK